MALVLGRVPRPPRVWGRASGALATFCLLLWVRGLPRLMLLYTLTFPYPLCKLHLNNAVQIILNVCNKCVPVNLPACLPFLFAEEKTSAGFYYTVPPAPRWKQIILTPNYELSQNISILSLEQTRSSVYVWTPLHSPCSPFIGLRFTQRSI